MNNQEHLTESAPRLGGGVIEKWRVVDSLPRYEASNLGRIRNRWDRSFPAVRQDNNGALIINTSYHGVPASRRVARMVGEAWCSKFKPTLRAFYRDGNKTNCSATNLRWVEPSKVTKGPFTKTPKPTN